MSVCKSGKWYSLLCYKERNEKTDHSSFTRGSQIHRSIIMPHPPSDWRRAVPTLQETVERERASAREWKQVATNLVEYLHHIDLAFTLVIGEAGQIERIFNAEAPAADLPALPQGSSGEELFRSVRVKMNAVVTFITNLTSEAVAAESAISDVYEMAHAALTTDRPLADTVPTTSLAFDPSDWGLPRAGTAPTRASSVSISSTDTSLTVSGKEIVPVKATNGLAGFLHS